VDQLLESFIQLEPGETSHRVINDEERKEISLITHEQWMNNLPGEKNCHFFSKKYQHPQKIILANSFNLAITFFTHHAVKLTCSKSESPFIGSFH
jgi:hypothetical protein